MTKVPPKKTGSIRRTTPITSPTYSKEEIEFKEKANPRCNKCNGTGRRGIVVAYRGSPCPPSPIPCKCVAKVFEAETIAADLKYREEHPEDLLAGPTGVTG